MNDIRTRLEFRSLKLQVHLGWSDDERADPQDVLVDVTCAFKSAPSACSSDDLAGTVCYGTLAEHVRERASSRPYRLIEKLAADLYACVRESVGSEHSEAAIAVKVTKIAPPVEDLLGGASFTYGEAV